MWSNPDGECVPDQSKPDQATNLYRYKTGRIPGNVEYDPSKRDPIFESGTFLFQLFYVIIPSIAGSLMFLFFFCTAIYLAFTTLRLFYLDTLKPYKRKTLNSLGKYRNAHVHRSSSGINIGGKKAKHRKLHDFKKDKTPQSERNFDKEEPDFQDLIHPAGQKLSFTSPPLPSEPKKVTMDIKMPEAAATTEQKPLRKSQASGPDNNMIKNLVKPVDGPDLHEFPKNQPSLYMEGGKPNYPSRIPVTTNRRNGPWVWDPNWYKKQVQDEKGTAHVVDKLTQTFLLDTPNEKSQAPKDTPNLPPKLLSSLLPAVTPNPSPTISPVTPASVPTPTPEVPNNVPMTELNPKTMSSVKVSPTRILSKPVQTAIPKIPSQRSYKQQFMILRGAPRKNSAAIEEMRRKRRSSEAGGDAAKTENEEPTNAGDTVD